MDVLMLADGKQKQEPYENHLLKNQRHIDASTVGLDKYSITVVYVSGNTLWSATIRAGSIVEAKEVAIACASKAPDLL